MPYQVLTFEFSFGASATELGRPIHGADDNRTHVKANKFECVVSNTTYWLSANMFGYRRNTGTKWENPNRELYGEKKNPKRTSAILSLERQILADTHTQ